MWLWVAGFASLNLNCKTEDDNSLFFFFFGKNIGMSIITFLNIMPGSQQIFINFLLPPVGLWTTSLSRFPQDLNLIMTYSHSNLILYLYVLIRKLFLLTSLLILFVSACQCAYACTYQNLAFYLEFNIFHRKHIFFFFSFQSSSACFLVWSMVSPSIYIVRVEVWTSARCSL